MCCVVVVVMMFAEGHVVDKGKEAAETINPEWKSQSTWRTRGKSRPDMIPEIRLIQGKPRPGQCWLLPYLEKREKRSWFGLAEDGETWMAGPRDCHIPHPKKRRDDHWTTY